MSVLSIGDPRWQRLAHPAFASQRHIASQRATAATLTPYRGGETNQIANGLLLRADLHTLLDCGLLTVDPDGLSVVVAPSIRGSAYGKLHGRALRPREAGCQGVSVDALRLRFEEFSKRHGT